MVFFGTFFMTVFLDMLHKIFNLGIFVNCLIFCIEYLFIKNKINRRNFKESFLLSCFNLRSNSVIYLPIKYLFILLKIKKLEEESSVLNTSHY